MRSVNRISAVNETYMNGFFSLSCLQLHFAGHNFTDHIYKMIGGSVEKEDFVNNFFFMAIIASVALDLCIDYAGQKYIAKH